MTRCKNGHIFHPTWFYTAQHHLVQSLLSWKFHGCILRQDFHPQYVPVEYVHTIKAYNPVKESHCAWQTPRKHKSGGYRNRKKWTCQTCLTGFGHEAENWTFLPFQSRHVMTRCKNWHVFHPTRLHYYYYTTWLTTSSTTTHIYSILDPQQPPTFPLGLLGRLLYKTRGRQWC